MSKLKELKKTIRQMRQRLDGMVRELGTFDQPVVAQSVELDQVLNQYYSLRRQVPPRRRVGS